MATRKPLVLGVKSVQELADADALGIATLFVSTSFIYGSNTRATDIALSINAAAGINKTLAFQSGGLNRFTFGATANAETGGQAGTNFVVSRWNDDGTFGGDVLTIYRNSNYIQFADIGTNSCYTNTAPAGDNSTLAASTEFVTRAVDGMTTLSTTGGTTTLTQAQAAAAVLLITGTLTSNATLVVPNSGIVTVVNRTSGSFTLTIKTASGAGTTVLQGTARNLIADGTNVVPAQSDYSGGRFDTITGTTNVVTPLVKSAATLSLASAQGTQLTVADNGYTTLMLNGAAPAATGQFCQIQFDNSNYWRNTFGGPLSYKAFNGHQFTTQSGTILNLPLTGSTSVNYLQIDQAATGAGPIISAQGTDTNIGLTISAKGTGVVNSTSDMSVAGYNYRSGATGLTAAGTTQATGFAIAKTNNVFTTVAASSGATLPNRPPVNGAFAEFLIVNGGANALLLYPPSGLSINALAANASLSVAAGASIRGVQVSTTNYRFG